MKTNALTWVGFIIVGLGWALLIAALTLSDAVLRAGNLVAVLSLRGDVVTVAQAAIVSGIGFSVIGVLRSGFGAFSQFFEAVLHRSSTPRSAQPSAASSPPPSSSSEPRETVTVMPVPVERPRPPPPPPMMSATPNRERNYVILADGSVEVETMFGTRVFATLEEARDFIR